MVDNWKDWPGLDDRQRFLHSQETVASVATERHLDPTEQIIGVSHLIA